MGSQSQTWLSNWTELNWCSIKLPWSQSEPTLNHCSRGNTRLGSRKPPVTTKNQYVTFCYVCFCLKTPYWLYIVDWLTLNSGPTALHLRPEEASPTHTFSKRHFTAILRLGTLNSTSLCLGAFKTARSPTKSTKCGTKLASGRTLVCSRRAEARRQSVVLFTLSWEHVHTHNWWCEHHSYK